MIEHNGYKFFYDSQGKLDCVNRVSDGATVWTRSRTFGELTNTFLGTNPNLGDRLDQATPIEKTANWSGFRVSMLGNSGYLRVTQLADSRTVSRLETAMTMATPDVLMIQSFWKAILDSLIKLNKPTATEVNQWKAIATANQMPFTFDSQGYLII